MAIFQQKARFKIHTKVAASDELINLEASFITLSMPNTDHLNFTLPKLAAPQQNGIEATRSNAIFEFRISTSHLNMRVSHNTYFCQTFYSLCCPRVKL